MHLLTLSINPTFLMRSNHFKEFKMDKKQVTDLRSELLDSRFGAKSISTIAESKRFPLHEMRDDVAFQIINDELYLDGNARQNLATFCQTWDCLLYTSYMVYTVVLIVIGGTLFTHKVGKRIRPLNVEKQRSEATFRTNLVQHKDRKSVV